MNNMGNFEFGRAEKPQMDTSENQELVEAEKRAETILTSIEDASESAVEVTSQTVKKLEASNIGPEKKSKLRNKLETSLKRLFRILSFGAVVSVGAATTDFEATRYFVHTETGKEGDAVYIHQDAETTHVINILSGREALNGKDKTGLIVSDGKVLSPAPGTYDQQLYKALWTLEQECGNPKIRFQRVGESGGIVHLFDPGTSFYDVLTNTVIIQSGSNDYAINNYIAELAHGKQFNDNPLKFIILGATGYLNTFKKALDSKSNKADATFGEKLAQKYHDLYGQKGSLENDAHSVIQPEL